ncbi:uncharacterized protein BX663DRAFT_232448 [Cokeromyces recurvatus]|uniref:uncharacterized protein n=1 Tax=Cokeromyces recurvatus TaxID=90255 RepID=UPI002220278B|nr:uncharacterized protein BX663DRAFT_232448 [Cokeromyces recurvatus]KAI7898844.1 hypothetical protein BX663DRAFT_232448 [Cokeromyces recurvatus]
MSKNTFYYEDGLEKIFNENGERVVDPMEDVLTDIIDPNIVLATLTSQAAYLAAKPEDIKVTKMKDVPANKVKLAKSPTNSTYRNYDDRTREKFIERMIKGPVKRGRVSAVARDLGITLTTANRWRKLYQKTDDVPYKKSEKNVG